MDLDKFHPSMFDSVHTNGTVHPQCMPDEYKVDTVIQSYRNYYMGDKKSFATWKNRDTPTWFI